MHYLDSYDVVVVKCGLVNSSVYHKREEGSKRPPSRYKIEWRNCFNLKVGWHLSSLYPALKRIQVTKLKHDFIPICSGAYFMQLWYIFRYNIMDSVMASTRTPVVTSSGQPTKNAIHPTHTESWCKKSYLNNMGINSYK